MAESRSIVSSAESIIDRDYTYIYNIPLEIQKYHYR